MSDRLAEEVAKVVAKKVVLKKVVPPTLPKKDTDVMKQEGWNTWGCLATGNPPSLDFISANLVEIFGSPAIAFACAACNQERQFMFIALEGAKKNPALPHDQVYFAHNSRVKLPIKYWRHIVGYPSYQMHTEQCKTHLCFLSETWIFVCGDNYSKAIRGPKVAASALQSQGKKLSSFNYFDAPGDYPIDELDMEISISLDIENLRKMRRNMSPRYKRKLSPLITKRIKHLETYPLLETMMSRSPIYGYR